MRNTYHRLEAISKTTAKRYGRLFGSALTAATGGIDRYLNACERIEVEPEIGTLREILDTASDRKFGKRPAPTKMVYTGGNMPEKMVSLRIPRN